MNLLPAEALVVHAHGLTSEESLDLTTTQRMDTALMAWDEGVASTLAVSGGRSFMLRTPPSKAEATVMEEYALLRGVPKENIAVEDKSLDTVGNVLFTKTKLAMPNDWEHLVVVTSASHLPRTLGIYSQVFGDDFDVRGLAAHGKTGIREIVYETLAMAMVEEVLRGTKPGDHEAIQERLFDLVPGYADGTMSRLAFRSLKGLFK